MKRILCIWLPNWPVQRQIAARPELRQRVVLLTTSDPRRGVIVASCCHAAAVAGVVPGMSLAEASALAGGNTVAGNTVAGNTVAGNTVAGNTVAGKKFVCRLPSDPWGDRQQLVNLAQACEPFSPLAGVEHRNPPSSLLLDVTRSAARLGGERQVMAQVRQLFCERGYTIRLALANTIGTAWAVSHHGPLSDNGPLFDDGLSACSESESSSVVVGHDEESLAMEFPFPGAVWVAPGNDLVALDRLPVASLRLEDTVCQQLAQLGITRIDLLRQLPRTSLSSRFGPQLLLRLDQATGALAETLEGEKRVTTPMAERDLETPITRRDVVQQILGQLVDQVVIQLTQQQQGVVQLGCLLQGAGGSSITLRVGLFEPAADPEQLKQLIDLQLERQAIGFAVEYLRVEALLTAVNQQRQSQLLSDQRPEITRNLSTLINRLSNRLGHLAVLQTRLLANQPPEHAFQEIPLTGRMPSPQRSQRRSLPSAATLWRPLRIIDPPYLLRRDISDSRNDLTEFDYRKQHHRIIHRWGPERIETRWWRGTCLRRDYYRIEDQQGARFWLFRKLQDGQWFLAGEFI